MLLLLLFSKGIEPSPFYKASCPPALFYFSIFSHALVLCIYNAQSVRKKSDRCSNGSSRQKDAQLDRSVGFSILELTHTHVNMRMRIKFGWNYLGSSIIRLVWFALLEKRRLRKTVNSFSLASIRIVFTLAIYMYRRGTSCQM